jgi:DNA polymerase-3 subunit delta'
MQFSEILGQEHIKNHLTKVQKWSSHAQLFVGPEGGTLAMAIAYTPFYVAIKTENGF